MNDDQKKIWEYLNKNAKGYARRISSTEIRDKCGLESGGPTNEHIRNQIRDMILNHGCCIGSLMYDKGYWVIKNEEELIKVIDSLNSRAESIKERATKIKENWEE